VIATLLKAGADVKAKDSTGKTAFDYSKDNEALKGSDAYSKLASSYAQTMNFFELVKTGMPQDVHAAIRNGADVNAWFFNGRTPLMYAAGFNKNPEVTTVLLKTGADPKAKDRMGKTAFDYAQENELLKGTDAYRQLEEASK
jgi:ankyrin repeat protein